MFRAFLQAKILCSVALDNEYLWFEGGTNTHNFLLYHVSFCFKGRSFLVRGGGLLHIRPGLFEY